MADEELNGGMTDEQEAPPSQEQIAETEQRARDEAGRFAPRGQPDPEAARRREASERDEWKRKYEERDKSAAEVQANYERLNKRLEDMAALAAGKNPDEEDEPSQPYEVLAAKMDAMTQRFETQDKQAQEEAAWTQVRSYADQDEARFAAATPDFPNAVQHYIQSRIGELNALGLPQDQAEATLQQEAQQLLMQCAQTRKSPAETIYALAKSRGYTAGTAPLPNNPAFQPQVPTGGRSLGTGQGGPGVGLTPQQLAQMDETDYMDLRKTPEGRRAIQRAMGG